MLPAIFTARTYSLDGAECLGRSVPRDVRIHRRLQPLHLCHGALARVAVVTTYNYVNPVVAIFLGWLFYREPFGLRSPQAVVVILRKSAIVNGPPAASPRRWPQPKGFMDQIPGALATI